MDTKYRATIEKKLAIAQQAGWGVDRSEINPILHEHQKDLVQWAAIGGRRAIFASFGLGKTMIQLELMKLANGHKEGNCLIVCPLGVMQEFKGDAEKLGYSVRYVRNDDEIGEETGKIYLTNYERVRDGAISREAIRKFTAVSLDEASVLRSYGSKTYQEFLPLFAGVSFRFVATATPSPNRYKELIHYAGYLGVMDTGQALTRFFERDSEKAGNLTLYPHMEKEFWTWVASWGVFITRPSDLGYPDAGYDLPPIHIHWHTIAVDHSLAPADKDGQGQLFRDTVMDLKAVCREKRLTVEDRVSRAAEIVESEPNEHWLIWHDREDERHAISKQIGGVVDIYGSMDLEERESRVLAFSRGEIARFATKPILSGSGCNFQRHCRRAVFVGIGFKFNDFIQAVHRIHRYLQIGDVHIHLIYAESEENIRRTLEEKWQRHDSMVANMTTLIRKHGLTNIAMANDLKRSIGCQRFENVGRDYVAVRNDTVVETANMETNSVDLIVTSIPFGNHYEYSCSYNDFGHNVDNDAFFSQMDHLTPELHRVLKPGRMYCCHVKDRIMFGNATGMGCPTVDPFHMLTTFHVLKHGFVFAGMITIETDVVRENNQTYRLGYTEQCKDGSKMGVGCPEYLLLFRKLPTDRSKAYADSRVEKDKAEYSLGRWQIDARSKWNSSGNRFLSPEELRTMPLDQIMRQFEKFHDSEIYDFARHEQAATELDAMKKLPYLFESLRIPARSWNVWSDVCRMRTLNGAQASQGLVKHICPLQFDIVDRCIERWSNKGELVYDPFGGIMTVPFRAVAMGRKGRGTELNQEYWRDGCRYLAKQEREQAAPTLFDLEGF